MLTRTEALALFIAEISCIFLATPRREFSAR
jgi:hypothetical protein